MDPKLRSSQGNRQSKTEEDGAGNGFGAAAEMALHWDSLWNKQPPRISVAYYNKSSFFLACEASPLTLVPFQSSSPLCSADGTHAFALASRNLGLKSTRLERWGKENWGKG